MVSTAANRNLRMLSAATLVNTVGSGSWWTAAAVFLTRSAGLSPSEVGLGLSIGGAAGLITAVPIGSLADRFDPRSVRATLQLAQGLIASGYLLVHSLAGLVVVAVLSAIAQTGNLAVRATLVSAVAGPRDRLRAFALLRAVASLGTGIGAAGAALAFVIDTRTAYVSLVFVDVATFVISAALLMRLPSFKPGSQPETRRAEALRDRPYLAVTAAISLISMHTVVLSLAVPIWIVAHTHAPALFVLVVAVTNTVLSVLLAVRFSRGIDAPAAAVVQLKRSGWMLGLSMVVFSLATGVSTVAASSILFAGALVYSIGDLRANNASSALSYALSNANLLGQYQGVSTLGTGLASTIGPALFSTVLLAGGRLGWWIVGLAFAVVGSLTPALTTWAVKKQSERPPNKGGC